MGFGRQPRQDLTWRAGLADTDFVIAGRRAAAALDPEPASGASAQLGMPGIDRPMLVRLFAIIFLSGEVGDGAGWPR